MGIYFLDDFFFFFFLRILFLEKGEGSEKEREEKHQCVVPSHVPPHQGPGPQPRHMPQQGIELVTPWFTDQHSIH